MLKIFYFFWQPLHHAARGEHADVIRLLLASGASVTKANAYGKVSIIGRVLAITPLCIL